ncbi:enoyl-CoA hydratase-related protein [Streptomyces sp. RKAG293]|uniref:enoyl-CoA hydratase-related protein n=1 Tax=Streptomyces sp. RKAG293 TaxID=2893403 RepID=UPI0035A8B8DA
MNTHAGQRTPTDPVVLTERREGVLAITLNRPRVRNAINQALAHALDTVLRLLDNDPELEVGILTGAGGHFCSGMDLKSFPDEGVPQVADRGLAGLTRARRTKPLIAAVEGAAVAGGFELVLACDLVTAADTAFFALPEVARGLIASEGGAIRLPSRLPHHLAMEMLLTARPLPAPEAARHALVKPAHRRRQSPRCRAHPRRADPHQLPTGAPDHPAGRRHHPQPWRHRGIRRPGPPHRTRLPHALGGRGSPSVLRETSNCLEPVTPPPGAGPACGAARGTHHRHQPCTPRTFHALSAYPN